MLYIISECMKCKRHYDRETNTWINGIPTQIRNQMTDEDKVDFSHTACPDCREDLLKFMLGEA
jgi:hypothetical protein